MIPDSNLVSGGVERRLSFCSGGAVLVGPKTSDVACGWRLANSVPQRSGLWSGLAKFRFAKCRRR